MGLNKSFILFRSNEFKEDDAVWKGGEDGGVGGGGPLPTGPNNLGPTGGYVAKYVLFCQYTKLIKTQFSLIFISFHRVIKSQNKRLVARAA